MFFLGERTYVSKRIILIMFTQKILMRMHILILFNFVCLFISFFFHFFLPCIAVAHAEMSSFLILKFNAACVYCFHWRGLGLPW